MIHYAFQLARGMTLAGGEVTLVTDRHFELDSLAGAFAVAQPLCLWKAKSRQPPAPWLRPFRRGLRGIVYYLNWLRLILFLKRLKPDFVLFGDIRFPVDALLFTLARRIGLRMVDICHNIDPYSMYGSSGGGFVSGRIRRAFYRSAYRQFERIYVHFDSNRERFFERFSIGKERIGTIPHGNESIFRELRQPGHSAADLRREHGLEPNEQVVLLFGGMSDYKGADLLIEAFAAICPTARKTRLILAGPLMPDFDLEALLARAAKAGCSDRLLVVPGYVPAPQVASWMELADVMALPYREIFQSGALALAQTFGVPTIVSNVGAMMEAADEGRAGLVVPPEDVEALASALRRLLADRELAKGLSRRSRDLSLRRDDWARIGGTILEDLQTLSHVVERSADSSGTECEVR